jgi:hypothetical protein
MTDSLQNVTIDEFLADSGWPATFRTRIEFALDFFRSIPLSDFAGEQPMDPVNDWNAGAWNFQLRGFVRRVSQWMQGIDFSQPLSVQLVPAGAELQRYHSFTSGQRWARAAAWYSEKNEDYRLLGLPSDDVCPAVYEVTAPVRALISTVADAHTFWGSANEYRHGGAFQYFIAKPSLVTARFRGEARIKDGPQPLRTSRVRLQERLTPIASC